MAGNKSELDIPSYVVGRLYSRVNDITGKYGGNAQSGIAASSKVPVIFIFSAASAEENGYEDGEDVEGCLRYCGEGRNGDQQMTRGNLALTTHVNSGKAIHYFKSRGKGKPYEYKGEFVYVDHETRSHPGQDGNKRKIFVFRLAPVAKFAAEELGYFEMAEDGPLTKPLSLVELRARALAACSPGNSSSAAGQGLRTIYKRAAQVKEYVLARASGVCELCNNPAPFLRKSDGTPYLEPHHINRVSDGGLDHPAHVGAICPACHREIHFGVNGKARNEVLRRHVTESESKLQSL